MIRLGVNVDHVATIRNARGSTYPDPLDAARLVLAAGADSITIHLREDRRHIRDADARRIRDGIAAPLNFEMAVTEEMRGIALALKPHAICLVPERRQEVTTEGGLDVVGQKDRLREYVTSLKVTGARVSLFIDPEPAQLEAAAFVGAAAVELHTGTYAEQTDAAGHKRELERLKIAAAMVRRIDIECHAGHGLTFDNVGPVAAIQDIIELNIGHFLVAEAMFSGLAGATRTMKQIMLLHRNAST